MKVVNNDESLLNSYHIPDNQNLEDYAMNPIRPNSLIIKNGVMYILGGVSSGKSTLLSKMIALYTQTIHPIILSFYGGLSPDETTTYALSSFGVKPHFIRLPTVEAMYSFYDQFKYKRIKLAELLMFLTSIYKNNNPLLLESINYVRDLNIRDKSLTDTNKRMKALLLYVMTLMSKNKINTDSKRGFIYLSEFITKTYARKHKQSFSVDPALFVCHCLISFSKGFDPYTVTVDILNEPGVKIQARGSNTLNRFHPYTFPPFIRVVSKNKIELVPSISVYDDIAQFPLLTTEHSNQWTKDLLAETRRMMNTFIFAAQRHSLLNKTLRSLTHTFFIGYSLIDDDIPKIAKEIPSNLLPGKDFVEMYHSLIKPFTFFVYNNRLGVNFIHLKKGPDPKQGQQEDNQTLSRKPKRNKE